MRLDIDLTDERVRLGKPADDALIQKTATDLGVQLPATYKTWLKEHANGAFFDMGNALQLFSLAKIEGEPFSVLS